MATAFQDGEQAAFGNDGRARFGVVQFVDRCGCFGVGSATFDAERALADARTQRDRDLTATQIEAMAAAIEQAAPAFGAGAAALVDAVTRSAASVPEATRFATSVDAVGREVLAAADLICWELRSFAVRTRADGSRSDVHDPKRGMDIHHGLSGNRRVAVERADHSRIVSERGGRGYVQHPYMYHGHEFGHRTYYAHGRAYDRFYGRYGYRGHYYDVYAPRAYYPYGFYGYAYAPWAAPVPYAWAPAPWVAPYSFYYAPYPVYPAPAFWLADFVFAASLAAAYEAGHNAGAEGAYLAPDATQYPTLAKFSASIGELLVGSAEAATASPAAPLLRAMARIQATNRPRRRPASASRRNRECVCSSRRSRRCRRANANASRPGCCFRPGPDGPGSRNRRKSGTGWRAGLPRSCAWPDRYKR